MTIEQIKQVAFDFIFEAVSAGNPYFGISHDYMIVCVEDATWENFVAVDCLTGKCELLHVR